MIDDLPKDGEVLKASAATSNRTLSSIAWVYGAFAVEKLSTLITTLVLARILVPEEFGLIASALLVIGLLATFRDLGVLDAVIFFDDRPRETTNSSFWIHVTLGGAQMALLMLAAPLIARAFNEGEEFVSILRAMSFAPLFASLGLTHNALMQKQLKFARRATIDFVTAVSKAVLTIYLAWLGWKEWALVIGFIFGAAFRSAVLWIAISWRPELYFSRDRALQMLHYGKHILGIGLIGNIITYVDQLAILFYFGKEPLAFYFVAARIPELLIYQITVVLTTVLFPMMSSMKSDPADLRNFVVESTRILSYIIFPLTLGIIATAEPFLEVTFGPTWIPSAAYLIVLTIGGLLLTSLWVVGDGLKSLGRPDVIWQIALIEMVVSVPATLFLVYIFQTPVAACFGMLSGIIVGLIMRLSAATQYLDIPATTFFEAFRPAALASLIMFGTVLLTKYATADVPVLASFLCEVLIGIVVYASTLWLIDGERLKADFGRFMADLQRDRLMKRAAERPGHDL